ADHRKEQSVQDDPGVTPGAGQAAGGQSEAVPQQRPRSRPDGPGAEAHIVRGAGGWGGHAGTPLGSGISVGPTGAGAAVPVRVWKTSSRLGSRSASSATGMSAARSASTIS